MLQGDVPRMTVKLASQCVSSAASGDLKLVRRGHAEKLFTHYCRGPSW